MLNVKRQIAAKLEASEGVAETLASADAKILGFDPKIVFDPDRLPQTASPSSLSKRAKVTGSIPASLTADIEVRGSGAVGTAPEWAKFLKVCGLVESTLKSITIGAITGGPFKHGETITGGTSSATGRVVIETATGTTTLYYVAISGTFQSGEVITGGTSAATATTGGTPATAGLEYKLTSVLSSVPSLTGGTYEDGFSKKIRGARGNCVFNFKAGKTVRMGYSLRGVKESAADLAMLSGIVHETTIAPIFQNASLVIGSYAAKVGEITIDIGNKLAADEDVNAAMGIRCFLIGDREPVGKINPRMVLAATNDFYGHWFGDAEKKLDFILGSAGGNKFRFYLPKIQYDKIDDAERDGIALTDISFTLNQNNEAGDDELTILAL